MHTCISFYTASYTKLDNEFLQNIGGINGHSLIKVLDPEIDEDEENFPKIINHSSYYDSEKLASTLQKCKNKFTILSTNIQSINAKIDELRLFVENLKTFNFMFSAICVQESWLAEGNDISLIQLEGYECIPQGKACSSKGGLIIYLHEHFKHKCRLKLDNYATWERQVIEVSQGKILNKPLYIGNIYRPPKENLEFYDQFINEFTPILNKLEKSNKEVILAGDYNIDLLKINDKNIISEYFDTLTGNRFYPKITVPTRLTNTRGTLIDNFICKLTENTLDTTAGVFIKKKTLTINHILFHLIQSSLKSFLQYMLKSLIKLYRTFILKSSLLTN